MKIRAEKPIIYDSSIYSWELDVVYSYPQLGEDVWKTLPLLESTVFVRSNESLQSVINSATEGSIILVHSGSYKENLFINKTLKIVSSDGCAATHVFGEVSITADGVILQGITFYPSSRSFSTLKVNSSFVTIVNCRFVNNEESLALYSPLPTVAIDCESCPHLCIVNNDFYGWKHAVLLKTTPTSSVQTNTFRHCHCAVLILSGETCKIRGNLFNTNVVGVQTPMSWKDKVLSTNVFYGNVIPLLDSGKFVLYPPLQTGHELHKHLKISNKFYVTGVCNVDVPRYSNYSKCVSIGSPKG